RLPLASLSGNPICTATTNSKARPIAPAIGNGTSTISRSPLSGDCLSQSILLSVSCSCFSSYCHTSNSTISRSYFECAQYVHNKPGGWPITLAIAIDCNIYNSTKNRVIDILAAMCSGSPSLPFLHQPSQPLPTCHLSQAASCA